MVWLFDLPEMPAGPVMELHGARKRFHVPQGLKPLLEEISVEVLRYQPANMYHFIAEYLEKKVYGKVTHDEEAVEEHGGEGYHGGHRHSWEWRRWSWQGSSQLDEQELELFLEEFHIRKDEAERYATIIQAAFRGHLSRERVKSMIHDKHLHDMAGHSEAYGSEALGESEFYLHEEMAHGAEEENVLEGDDIGDAHEYEYVEEEEDVNEMIVRHTVPKVPDINIIEPSTINIPGHEHVPAPPAEIAPATHGNLPVHSDEEETDEEGMDEEMLGEN